MKLSDIAKADRDYEVKKARGEALKFLTNNGQNRRAVKKLEQMMSDKETLEILNALFVATGGKK
jgi:hypothetical protein